VLNPAFGTLGHLAIEPRPAPRAACWGLTLVLAGVGDAVCAGVDARAVMIYTPAQRLENGARNHASMRCAQSAKTGKRGSVKRSVLPQSAATATIGAFSAE